MVALGVAAYQTIRWAEGPVIPAQERPPSTIVVIPDGSTFQYVVSLLERERLIKSRMAFVLFGKFQSADRKVHAGEYELNPGMTPADILSKLLNGHVLLHPLTIPEGLTIAQIADVVSQQGITDRVEFLRLVKDQAFIASLGIKAEKLDAIRDSLLRNHIGNLGNGEPFWNRQRMEQHVAVQQLRKNIRRSHAGIQLILTSMNFPVRRLEFSKKNKCRTALDQSFARKQRRDILKR